MLNKLTVKNFAIIEDLTIDFSTGLTVLTGETGAGKSLIIDTLLLLLGGRADTDMVRYGEDSATIVGEFTLSNQKLIEYVQSLGISIEKTLVIKREIKMNGKNTVSVNKTAISLQLLKNIAIMLADIHVQNDTFKLFSMDNYLDFIDPKEDENFLELMNKYILAKDKFTSMLKKYKYILNNQNKTKERIDILKYEESELSSLELTQDCDILLEEEISRLKNFDKIYQNLNLAYESFEDENSSLDKIYDVSAYLSKISKYSKEYEEAANKVNDAYYVLDEVKSMIYNELKNLDFDETVLDRLEERSFAIKKAKDKYKKDVNALIEYLKEIKLQISMVEDFDMILKEALADVEKTHKELVICSKSLTSRRKNISKTIVESIIKECADLELPNVDFEITFADVDYSDPLNDQIFTDVGVDKVDFLISLNKGEPKKSLAKVASGGEMSRIMLAFKTYFSKTSKLELMVFDEIDTGISGSVASQIAKKMKEISKNTQVLCITHLPQVAAIGDRHYYIYKIFENDRTKTQLEILSQEKRIEQIAVMLSGNRITKFALEHAKELLIEAQL